MNRNVPPIPTLIFLILVLNSIYQYALRVDDLSPTIVQQVVQDESGTVWALFGSTLIDISDSKENRSFAQHGFENHVGQTVPLASGEWLLNVGAQNNYVKKAIQRALRDTGEEYQASGSLLKCSSSLSQCQPWGEARLQFERAFDGMELEDGRLLLFQAEQGRIFLVSRDGFIVSEVENEQMWFGVNQIEPGVWFGLNTERRELSELTLVGEQIKIEKLPINLMKLDGQDSGIYSSSKIVEYKNNYWLLGNQDITEDFTTRKAVDVLTLGTPQLLSIDVQTEQLRRLPFVFRADAELEKINDSIYFSDFDKHEIKRFDLLSETMALVESDHLNAAFDADASRIAKNKKVLYRVLLLNGFAVLVAFIWLVKSSTPIPEEKESSEIEEAVIKYGLPDKESSRALAHVARVFAKKELTKAEASVVLSFRKIDGDYIYYPHGIMGKGRIVPDAETLVGLYDRTYANYQNAIYMVSLPLLALPISFLVYGFSPMIGLVMLAVSMLALLTGITVIPLMSYFRRRALLKNTVTHDSNLPLSHVIETISKTMSPKAILFLIAAGALLIILMVALFVFLPGADNAETSISAIVGVSTGAVACAIGVLLKRAKARVADIP